jgi:hypothetical protein
MQIPSARRHFEKDAICFGRVCKAAPLEVSARNRFRYTQRALAVSIAWRWAYLLPLISNANLNRDGLGCLVIAARDLFSYVLNIFKYFLFSMESCALRGLQRFSLLRFSKIGQISNNAERIVRPHFQCKVY